MSRRACSEGAAQLRMVEAINQLPQEVTQMEPQQDTDQSSQPGRSASEEERDAAWHTLKLNNHPGGEGEIRAHFFDHHGAIGSEQYLGCVVFPDYSQFDETGESRPLSVDEMATRMADQLHEMSRYSLGGVCTAIVGPGDPIPTHGEHQFDDVRFARLWRLYEDRVFAASMQGEVS